MPRSGGMARAVRRRQLRSEKENQDIIVSIGMLISENAKECLFGHVAEKNRVVFVKMVLKNGMYPEKWGSFS